MAPGATAEPRLFRVHPRLLFNPSKTEWKVQDLNKDPRLPFDNASFDVVTNSLSVDYLTSPLEVFREMHRVLRPEVVPQLQLALRHW